MTDSRTQQPHSSRDSLLLPQEIAYCFPNCNGVSEKTWRQSLKVLPHGCLDEVSAGAAASCVSGPMFSVGSFPHFHRGHADLPEPADQPQRRALRAGVEERGGGAGPAPGPPQRRPHLQAHHRPRAGAALSARSVFTEATLIYQCSSLCTSGGDRNPLTVVSQN